MFTKSLLALACLGCAFSAYAAPPDGTASQFHAALDQPGLRPAITPEFSTFVNMLRKQYSVHGVSVGVVHRDGHTEYGSWGIRTEDGDPTTPNTLFQIGSCSKAFLAAGLGILIEDFSKGLNTTALPLGLQSFSWETAIQDLFPGDSEWRLYDYWATERATLRDVLSHVSGLPSYDLSYKPTDTPLDVVKRMRHLKPTFELRQQYQYNNQMYMLGVHIVETYSGTAYFSFIKERIFNPLNMTSTTYYMDSAIKSGNMSHAFTANYRRIPYHLADWYTARLLGGAGSLISSAVDMTKWVAMLLNKGVNPYTQEVVVPPQVLAYVTWAYSIMSGAAPSSSTSIYGYGMGWTRYTYKGHEVVAHSGGLPGFMSYTAFLPWEGFGAVVLVNNDFQAGEVPGLLFARIVETVLALPRVQSPGSDTIFQDPSFPIFFDVMPNLHGMPKHPMRPSSILRSAPVPSPSLPLSSYAGTYTSPTYGTLTLCSPNTISVYCRQVFGSFGISSPRTADPGLYAVWPTVWSTHLVFKQRSGHRFSVEVLTVHPQGYGKNRTRFEERLYGSITFAAEFTVDRPYSPVHVTGFTMPAGFEMPESFLGLGGVLEKLQIHFEKVALVLDFNSGLLPLCSQSSIPNTFVVAKKLDQREAMTKATLAYIDALKSALPAQYSSGLQSLPSPTLHLIDAILRFTSGGECPEDAELRTKENWKVGQDTIRKALEGAKVAAANGSSKRTREDAPDDEGHAAKKTYAAAHQPDISGGGGLYIAHLP
ncbi:hypothetical protein NM688_g5077 [Phlebia brevispora]|uniref:Uncharacterized protein n=1 Tax=Phlebia brevispora TaxID=194682 RepID=A0ACC1T122_9APHY|nr:hypothetical protein NM688_g5077 [Phlebia brevispora]